ncbi:MAG: DUF1275 domain-containing protein [Flavobacterium sp.]|nr:DUF1275 domain-containing protein [Flavobacterium sp.]
MFKHQGKRRTPKHNLQIASLLSFVAGIVNVAGFLAVAQLTTNVTGHFAFFVDEMFKLKFIQSAIYFLYVIFFFIGAFCSSFLVELISRKNEIYMYLVPIAIECGILLLIALYGDELVPLSPNLIACSLLFAMGLQNSLVTRISNSVVRTTHLTGLFTDLGIEISQLFFYSEKERRKKLFTSINLKLIIICFFFIGGILAGVLYSKIGLTVLLIGSFALFIGMIYDHLKVRVKLIARKYRN